MSKISINIGEQKRLNILKAFGADNELEKGHNVGDVHPNGKLVWTEYSPGKFDWRNKKKEESSTDNNLSEQVKTAKTESLKNVLTSDKASEELKQAAKKELEKREKPITEKQRKEKLDEELNKKVKEAREKNNVKKETESTTSTDKYPGLTEEEIKNVKEVKPSTIEDIQSKPTYIEFGSQKLMNFWKNEMSGQISDGMWENSKGTNWIWSASYGLSDDGTTKVYTKSIPGRRDYSMDKSLKDMYAEKGSAKESGFASDKEMQEAWKEIKEAIKNTSVLGSFVSSSSDAFPEKVRKQLVELQIEETKMKSDAIEKYLSDFKKTYSFSWEKEISRLEDDRAIKLKVDPDSVTIGTSTEGKKIPFIACKVEYYGRINPFVKVNIPMYKISKYSEAVVEFLKKIN